MPFSQGFLPRHRTLGKLSEPTYRSLAQVVLLDQLGHLPLIWSKQPAHGDHHRLIQLLFLERREYSISLPVRWGFEAGSASLTERMQGSLEIPSRKHFSNERASGLNLPFFQGVRGGNSWFQYHLTLTGRVDICWCYLPSILFSQGSCPLPLCVAPVGVSHHRRRRTPRVVQDPTRTHAVLPWDPCLPTQAAMSSLPCAPPFLVF